jgi:hypothetical protein
MESDGAVTRIIADIACARGFEYPTYFNNYYKKLAGTNPKSLRVMRFEILKDWSDIHYLSG